MQRKELFTELAKAFPNRLEEVNIFRMLLESRFGDVSAPVNFDKLPNIDKEAEALLILDVEATFADINAAAKAIAKALHGRKGTLG